MPHQTAVQKAIFKRSLEQAADRRFRRMRCRLCQRRFSSKKSYRFHMLNDYQIRNVQFIKCKLCDAEFAYKKGLKVHMFKIHNTLLKDEMIVKQLECDICSMVYRSEDELKLHKASVHGSATAASTEQQGGADEITVTKFETEASSAANPADRSGISTPASSVGGTGGSGAADRLKRETLHSLNNNDNCMQDHSQSEEDQDKLPRQVYQSQTNQNNLERKLFKTIATISEESNLRYDECQKQRRKISDQTERDEHAKEDANAVMIEKLYDIRKKTLDKNKKLEQQQFLMIQQVVWEKHYINHVRQEAQNKRKEAEEFDAIFLGTGCVLQQRNKVPYNKSAR
ncbi:zinc finger protein hangover-like isoform X2 [Eurosta solidaginis]|uniref:zinc finger protein hangover-like isoform X2 n=1 Tax=Eurosta solidaginis TaxID=178769 RepID=UPI003530A64B